MAELVTMNYSRTARLSDWQDRLDYAAAVLFAVTGVRLIPVWRPFITMDLEDYCTFHSFYDHRGDRIPDVTMLNRHRNMSKDTKTRCEVGVV